MVFVIFSLLVHFLFLVQTCITNSFLDLWLFRFIIDHRLYRSLILCILIFRSLFGAIPRPPPAACLILWYLLICTFVLDQCLLNVFISSVVPRSGTCLIYIEVRIFSSRLACRWPEPPSTFLLSRFFLFLLIFLLMSVFGRLVFGTYPCRLLCWIVRLIWLSCRTWPKPPVTRLLVKFNFFFYSLVKIIFLGIYGVLLWTRSNWCTGHDSCRSQYSLSWFILFVTEVWFLCADPTFIQSCLKLLYLLLTRHIFHLNCTHFFNCGFQSILRSNLVDCERLLGEWAFAFFLDPVFYRT